jgi:hypothetical protein
MYRYYKNLLAFKQNRGQVLQITILHGIGRLAQAALGLANNNSSRHGDLQDLTLV